MHITPIYIAHPFGGSRKQLRLALNWIEWCCNWAAHHNRDNTQDPVLIQAPWIAYVETLKETPELRTFGMNAALHHFRLLADSHPQILVFGGWSRGTRYEAWLCSRFGGRVFDCTRWGDRPPASPEGEVYFDPRDHPLTDELLGVSDDWAGELRV